MSKTISQVSRELSVSTRTLRYYEQIGLIHSARVEGYAYRVYDEDTLLRLRRIVFLRQLRIPLRSIGVLLECRDAGAAVDVLRARMDELHGEIEARRRAVALLARLEQRILQGESAWDGASEALLMLPPDAKEASAMTQPIPARLNDVRILALPRMAVAAAQFTGPDPESHASALLQAFIRDARLADVKPDARVFGFNHPQPQTPGGPYGYEFWVTIPEDMDVPAPLAKRTMPGGLYAAHAIRMGDFHEWAQLVRWAETDALYAPNHPPRSESCMGGCLEEHLNFLLGWPEDESQQQLDLLLPIRER